MKVKVMNFNKCEQEVYAVCCDGQALKGKQLKSSHWNENKVKWVCPKCKRSVITNGQYFDSPKKHCQYTIELEEKCKKIL